MQPDLRRIRALFARARSDPRAGRALQAQWDAFGAAGARCAWDEGPLALMAYALERDENEYAFRCVDCGRKTPRFVVVEGIAVLV